MAVQRGTVTLVVGTFVLAAALLVCQKNNAQNLSDDADFLAQITTVSNVRALVAHITLYRENHAGRSPSALAILCDTYGMDEKFLTDGWGRPIAYFASANSYFLVSLGRNGKPEGQVVDPGGIGRSKREYDMDIGWILDGWTQTPYAVDR